MDDTDGTSSATTNDDRSNDCLLNFLTSTDNETKFNEETLCQKLKETPTFTQTISKLPQKTVIFLTQKLIKTVSTTNNINNSIVLAEFLTEIMKIHGGLIISSGKTVKNMKKFYGLRQEIENYDRTMRRLEGKLEYFVPGSLQSADERSTSNFSSGYQINFSSQEINCATQMVEEDSTDSEGEDNSESDSRESELDEILGEEDEEQDEESDESENSEMADPNNNGVIVDEKGSGKKGQGNFFEMNTPPMDVL